jgi:hypothetical protein
MTYPVDDAGNPRVDFVWGNMAMQPNDQRDVITSGPEPLFAANAPGNFGWDATYVYPSEGLYASVEQHLSVGDQSINHNWDDVSYRTVSVPADNHSTALTGYQNYPAFLPNYAGDGDTGLEALVPNLAGIPFGEQSLMNAAVVAAGFVYASTTTHIGATTVNDGNFKSQSPAAGTKPNAGSTVTVTFYNAPEVPNVVGLTESAANIALLAAHVVKGAVTTADNAAGATAINDGLVKTQTPAAGTTVNTDSSVALVKYAYTSVNNTNIAGFSVDSFPGHSALTGGEIYMHLTGRTTKPTVGNIIAVAETTNTSLNRNWTVNTVEDNDFHNTGGTVVKMTANGGAPLVDPNTPTPGGYWTLSA